MISCRALQWPRFERLRWRKCLPDRAKYNCEAREAPIEERHKPSMRAEANGAGWPEGAALACLVHSGLKATCVTFWAPAHLAAMRYEAVGQVRTGPVLPYPDERANIPAVHPSRQCKGLATAPLHKVISTGSHRCSSASCAGITDRCHAGCRANGPICRQSSGQLASHRKSPDPRLCLHTYAIAVSSIRVELHSGQGHG